MSNISEFDARQFGLMIRSIEDFKSGQMSLGRLYNNLDFLLLQVSDGIDKSYKTDLKEDIDQLEILNAVNIEGMLTAEELAEETARLLKPIEQALTSIDQ